MRRLALGAFQFETIKLFYALFYHTNVYQQVYSPTTLYSYYIYNSTKKHFYPKPLLPTISSTNTWNNIKEQTLLVSVKMLIEQRDYSS